MAATKTRHSSANRRVTLRLHGWPKEVRKLSVVDACWMVDLEFKGGNQEITRSLNVFTSDDYARALRNYQQLKIITED